MKYLYTLCFACVLSGTVQAQQLAFPGAEGYGAYATGGRGCQVVHVTNLNASGPGSLAEAVGQSNRFVVFDVGGVIDITGTNLTIASNITIAGQTAPGEGITIYGGRVIASKSKNIIMRYIRMRGGKSVNQSKCTLTLDECQNFIMDHCSVSWGPWDNVHIKDANNITWQYCINSEGIEPQRFGSITDGTRNWTIHHCLWADNKSRNPKMKCYLQYYNNVVYNFAMGIIGGHSAADNYQDVVNNYFIAGPNGSAKYFDDWTATDHLYSSGNYFDGNCDGVLNGTLITDHHNATAMSRPNFNTTHPMNVETAAEAYQNIVDQVGASRVRDPHDLRIIEQLTSLGKKGSFIANEDELGGIGFLANGLRPTDSDNDGMADEWETANGLNPTVNDANGTTLGGGYTNIEHYVNSLAQKSDEQSTIDPRARSLEATLSSALNLVNGAQVDVTLGFPSQSIDQLKVLIADAQTFLQNLTEQTSQKEIDAQETILNNGVKALNNARIYTLEGFSTEKAYNIYSYGTHSGAKDADAKPSIQRRYLYALEGQNGKAGQLVYRIGLSDNDINAGKKDAIAAMPAALWGLEAAGNGYVKVRNLLTGNYMQMETSLSANPIAIHPTYAKQDNGKMAFYMDATEEGKRLFNVGAPDADGKGGPVDFFAMHADRTRLRWVFEQTEADVVYPTAIQFLSDGVLRSVRFFTLQGVEMENRPSAGIYLECTTKSDGTTQVRKIMAQ